MALEGGEAVVSQEMVRHGSVDETLSGDTDAAALSSSSSSAAAAAATAVETEGLVRGEESKDDGWLTGWKLPVLSDVVSKTSSVVQQTVQQTSNVVCFRVSFLSYLFKYFKCNLLFSAALLMQNVR